MSDGYNINKLDQIRLETFLQLATSSFADVSPAFMASAEKWAAEFLGWVDAPKEEETENRITLDLPEETLDKLREVTDKLRNYGNSFYYN